MKFLRVAFIVGVCLSLSLTAHAENKQKKEGSTRVKGSVNVKKVGDTYTIDIKVSTRKSGVSGTGKGVVEVQLLDDTFQPKRPIRVQKTVGANAIRGTAEKSADKQLLGLPASKFNGLLWGIKASDSIGFPTSLNALKKFLKDEVGEFIEIADVVNGLDAGKSKSYGDFSIMRLP